MYRVEVVAHEVDNEDIMSIVEAAIVFERVLDGKEWRWVEWP